MATEFALTERQMSVLVEFARAWDLDNADALRAAEVQSLQRNLPVKLRPEMVEHLGHALFLVRALEV